ncbi:PAS domain S-box-containing protein [Desulfuromusa kysingii]|uniref:histidine kinase n=1 Tax=Desulfuromusa kysingii TaxID=37625 RepID=A0A1H3VYK6_9BACT|nr:response regulator [Desulfuromusa kysingii]SDZ79886.1 PAS domain S-box-containing protein [Desulfuromusa kysingii]
MHIIIAADQPDSCLMLEKTLVSSGHQVTRTFHGKDALKKALNDPPEIIISNVSMPDMDGFQFCYSVKSEERLRNIPFVFYTTTDFDQEDERLAMALGAARYIVKPVELSAFLQDIKAVITEVENGTLLGSDPMLDEPPGLLQRCNRRLTKKLTAKVCELESYKDIFRQVEDPICIISPTGDILESNFAHKKLYNNLKCQSAGDSLTSCLNAEELSSLLNQVLQGSTYQQAIELTLQHDEVLHVVMSASGIRDATGQVTTIILISRDQTELHQRDSQLHRFHNMVDQSNDAYFIIDAANGNIRDVNKRACTRYGYSHEEMTQQTILKLNPTYQQLENWLQRVHVMTVNETIVFETIHKAKSGEVFPVEISHQTVVDEESHYIIAVARDISERKAAEEQERKSQRLWKRTFDSISDIITIQDLEHRITQCNSATAETFNLQPEECIGKHCYELFTGSDTPCPKCPAGNAVKNLEPYSEEIFHAKLGKTFSINVSPIFDDNGTITGISHFAKDITEQKKLAEQLRQAQKMESIGTLAGGIAHDFNNILSAIMGYTQLAQLHIPQNSKALEALNQVIAGGQRATELVKQILSFSRKTGHQMAPVTVQDVISEALKLLRPSLPATIDIRLNIDQDCPPIFANEGQIHQIIMNLCTNAYHAMREQKSGILEMSLQKTNLSPEIAIPHFNLSSGQYLLFTIRDTGTGMDEATLGKIFDPYFTTKKAGEGTGLGLAVANGIIHSFGGYIAVDSKPDQGSCFKIYLPVSKELPAAEKKTTLLSNPSGTETILVVDDEESISSLIKNMLERYGYQVTSTSSSSEALMIFARDPGLFDLVITDYTMPQMNGIDLATELFKICPDLPILLCTGFSDINSTEKALEIGIKSCINKPMQADQLALSVRQLLDRMPEKKENH